MTEQLKTSLMNEGMRRIYDYWMSRRKNGRLPRREDIDPSDVTDLLPHIFLVDIEENPRHYRFRLVGTKVVECFGLDMTGKTIDSLDLGDDADAILKHYDQAVDHGEPIYDRHRFWTEAYGQHLNYERLLLPLSSDGKRVDKLLGCTFTLPLTEDAPAPKGAAEPALKSSDR
jgi:hypothetical protein